jgi:hypothetical protein
LDKEALVTTEADIPAGQSLLATLDQRDFPVVAALWERLPDVLEWRLVLASPLVDQFGRRKAYQKLAEAWASSRELVSLSDVELVSPSAPIIRALRSALSTPPFSGIRLTAVTFGDVFIPDLYLYRLLPSP